MKKSLLSNCPRCEYKLVATNLRCNDCELELKGEFQLSKFDYLSKDDLQFILNFIKNEGNFKAVQEDLNISYLSAKNRISKINNDLGLKKPEVVEDKDIKRVNETDSLTVKLIKEKLDKYGGKATIELLQGDPCDIWYSKDGSGLESNKIPLPKQLTWEVFDTAIELVLKEGGRVDKGNARNGKLGDHILPMNSLEGYIAHKVHGIEEGQSAFGPGFVISAILDWACICNNKRGYIEITPEFLMMNK